MTGVIGIKCGSTRLYAEDGSINQVTVIHVQENFVTAVRTKEQHGYEALQLASIPYTKKVNKPIQGQYKKAEVATQSQVKEFKVANSKQYNLGDVFKVDFFDNTKSVVVTGTTKGKGFAGCVKRHNFKMQRATHGNSLSHRAPGAIGQCQFPGRVNKGKKMAGHMGNAQRSIKNLDILKIDKEKNLIFVKGSIPGKPGAVVFIKKYKAKVGEK